MTNVYDQGARYTLRLDIPGLLPWLLQPPLAATLLFRDWLDTRSVPYPGEPDRVCDTVAALDSLVDPHWLGALLMDPQTRPDPRIRLRTVEYVIRLVSSLECGTRPGEWYQIVAVVLNLTGEEQDETLEMRLPGAPEVGLEWTVKILCLAQMSAAETLAGIERGDWGRSVLPFVPLLHRGGEADTIEKWKELAAQEPDDRRRSDYGGLAQVFANLKPWSRGWQDALKEWNVLTSPIVEQWKAEAAAQANLHEARKIVMLAGRAKLGEPPARKVADLDAITDVNALEQMVVRLFTVDTWDELLKI